MDTPQEQQVLQRFLVDGRLVRVPSKRAKRMVVLDHLAQRFEPGRTYPEREVDAILVGYHGDYPALRRYLVEEGFLTREANVYWRTGGSFQV